MRGQIRTSEGPLTRCPGINCDATLLDRETKYLEPEHHKRLLMLGVEQAVASAGDAAFHCMVPDCPGVWFVSEVANGRFDCPVCNEVNCLICKVVHANRQSCDEYRQDVAIKKSNTQAELQSHAHIQDMLDSGHAMLCPRCTAIVQKTIGCDAITCIRCHTELCWATKGLRWGPNGKGDWSSGCRCRYRGGPLCHPDCQSCH
ncbi:ranBP-type and C3HC4-type zinc finger-containing protein 1 isoform 2-like [Tropilaelaps mercedesae]|uniref:RanBP-type and C3HC4-type zinc finger-containing protein 1 isoform 2-like n=1 Tax=Tropilaelaps mercedesae TaxID=418985 RepID=A0A1V9XEV6_9ACAR|nr:ranBP-type and C3HC4-type zinc finger-containing protein 1 isoform 2-like [Tropilaelaps mercedesae]